jgi:hypothetical protein
MAEADGEFGHFNYEWGLAVGAGVDRSTNLGAELDENLERSTAVIFGNSEAEVEPDIADAD